MNYFTKVIVLAYIERLVTAVSRLINVIVGGHTNETLSGRSYRQRDDTAWSIAYELINLMFFWQENHCKMMHLYEVRLGLVNTDMSK